MKKAQKFLSDWINNNSNNNQKNEHSEYSETEVIKMLSEYKKDQREQLIRYQIKITSCTDEQAEIYVDSYLATLWFKINKKPKLIVDKTLKI